MDEKQEHIRNVMLKAMAARLCTNQKEFAEIVGISRSGLSSAMNGDQKNLTDSLVRKIRAFAPPGARAGRKRTDGSRAA